MGRGDNGGPTDNKALIPEILGCASSGPGCWATPPTPTGRWNRPWPETPERALALMEAVWRPAAARVRAEVAEMQALADRTAPASASPPGTTASTWSGCAEQAPAWTCRGAALPAAGPAAGGACSGPRAGSTACTFTRSRGPPGAAPGRLGLGGAGRPGPARGALVPSIRSPGPARHSGAWMSNYRRQERMGRSVRRSSPTTPTSCAGAPVRKALISWDDAVTLFHEFGHALHGLLSQARLRRPCRAPRCPATSWSSPPSSTSTGCRRPELLDRFALHHRTGEPIPAELVAKIAARRRPSTRASRPWSTWPRPCST